MRILIITGLSGSGKSTAVRALEDEGFFCIDNLPVSLVPRFLELVRKSRERVDGVALVMDIRGRDFLKGYEKVFQEIRQSGYKVEIFFFDATDEVLIRRFSETRRRHPALENEPVTEAIRFEREQLAGLRKMADEVVDTSELNVHQLKELTVAKVKGAEGPRGMTVHLQSFGFRYGLPLESDMVLDVRFLPNPHFVPELTRDTGVQRSVSDYVLRSPQGSLFLEKLQGLLETVVPEFRREGKSYLTISVGCTGGRHRSVAIIERLRDIFGQMNVSLKVTHRDIEKGEV
jgi:RNase adapter protein RapZ